MTITNDVRNKFGSWINSMAPFIESKAFDDIMLFLKGEAAKKKVICPVSKDLFKSFQKCSKDKMKALILLQDPYPTFRDNVMIADGIPLSCSYTKYHQPSLYMWHNQVEKEYGFHPGNELRNDLSYLLEDEHVMLLNCGLSCEKDKSGSHNEKWSEFMKWFFKIINEEHRGLPIALCGSTAHKYEKEINPLLHYIKKVEHPVAAAYANREWKADNMFTWINSIIESNNGPAYKVRWTRQVNEEKEYPEWITKPIVGIPSKEEQESILSGLPWEKDIKQEGIKDK